MRSLVGEIEEKGNNISYNSKVVKVLFDSDMIQQVGRFGIIKESINYQDLIRKNHRDGLKKVRDILFEEYNNIFTNNGRKMAEEGYKFVKDFFTI